jgi:hypothetical protein
MSEKSEFAARRVLSAPPALHAVSVRRDIEIQREGQAPLRVDLYSPEGVADDKLPAVIIAAGYPDAGFEKFIGCRFKELGSTDSWARIIAASGIAVITYANQHPVDDFVTLLNNFGQLELDTTRVAVWASSGNAPLALSALMHDAPRPLNAAVFCYGMMLDGDGSTAVADAAKQFGFANPTAGRTIADVADVPIFLVRAGKDEFPGVNESIDRFVRQAMERNLPLTVVNHPNVPHAFDLVDDGDDTRAVIQQIVDFLRQHLGVHR